ncbi:hypothetical protein EON83_20665 [bacterium]|nr:MAG: hypothetical protein EON83_20665 [bacterium]
MNKDKQLTMMVNGACVFIIVTAVAFMGFARMRLSAPKTTAAAQTSASEVPIIRSVQLSANGYHNTRNLNADKFKRLKMGMNYAQVLSVIGSKGSLTAQMKEKGVSTDVYLWQNPNGSNVSVGFRRDRLVFKSSYKLKGIKDLGGSDNQAAKKRA